MCTPTRVSCLFFPVFIVDQTCGHCLCLVGDVRVAAGQRLPGLVVTGPEGVSNAPVTDSQVFRSTQRTSSVSWVDAPRGFAISRIAVARDDSMLGQLYGKHTLRVPRLADGRPASSVCLRSPACCLMVANTACRLPSPISSRFAQFLQPRRGTAMTNEEGRAMAASTRRLATGSSNRP
jgi:hypothetical protein